MTRRCLIIFAREPLPGRVKSRLAADVGDEAAVELYEAMLLDVLEISRGLTGIESVVFWDCAAESLPLLSERFGCQSRRQADGDLGQRMQAAFAEMFSAGFESCCIIGSDAPDLPPDCIKRAFEILESGQSYVVFGPSSDGGYYLLGLKQIFPQLFREITWSSPFVLQQSLTAAQAAGAVPALLPVWHDIDTRQDLNSFLIRSARLCTANRTSIRASALYREADYV